MNNKPTTMNNEPITTNPKRGFSLIPLILIIIVVGIIIGSTSTFIMQSVKFNLMNAQKTQALLAAQAGLMQAAYFTLRDSSYTDEAEAQLINSQWYLYNYTGSSGGGGGGDASNYVYLNGTGPVPGPPVKVITGWAVVNNDANPYTITGITVYSSAAGTLQYIYLNNSQVWPASGKGNTAISSSGTFIDVDKQILANQSFTDPSNYFTFKDSMTNSTISGALHFGSITSPSYQVYLPITNSPPSVAGTPTTIVSTGEVKSGSNIVMRKSITASFEVASGQLTITKYDEF